MVELRRNPNAYLQNQTLKKIEKYPTQGTECDENYIHAETIQNHIQKCCQSQKMLSIKFLFHHMKLRGIPETCVATLVTMYSEGTEYDEYYIRAESI